jgi:saccharopine dehydrogenase-like NADP-dependent oxidoreductase
VSTAGELHIVFGSGPVGVAVVETLLAQGRKGIRVVSRRRTGARDRTFATRSLARRQ